MWIGPYTIVHNKLEQILRDAKAPGANFSLIAAKVNAVDIGMKFPDYNPVSWAKFAVTKCLGPGKIKDSRLLAEADGKLSSCRIADNQYFDKDGNLRPEYQR